MTVTIVEEGPDCLEVYGEVSIAFHVKTAFTVEPIGPDGLGGFQLTETAVEPAWLKDYDAEKDEGPTRWRRWDLPNWGFAGAYSDNRRVGGAVVAFDTENLDFLEGRKDLAALWDIRVVPDYRRNGVGAMLFRWAADWAREKRCKVLKIETQNINVPACKFYARQGAVLGTVKRFAYPSLPDEVELDWYLDLLD